MPVLFWCSVNSAAAVPFSASGFGVGGMLVILCDGRACFQTLRCVKPSKRQNIGRVMLNFPLFQISNREICSDL